MMGVSVERPHRDSRIAMRPSRFLLAAMAVFIAVTGAAVFGCVLGHFGWFHAVVASSTSIAALSFAARRWWHAQPVAIESHADSLTTWSRSGEAQHWRIVGCAQLGGRFLTLTLSSDQKRTLLIAADSINPDVFRQLAVHARRAAQAYL
jgi:hypothetical protein